ncbi:MAG: hypothetical protein INQ03_12290 [Candidatus Heimdallarchaeota archaeon]|nr:hypothetical protein [Candidatus Heimdallarchaeota archaeon]
MNQFRQMAHARELEANALSDREIYKTMISKIIKLKDLPIEVRSDMILQAISDNLCIYEELKSLKEQDLISSYEVITVLKGMSKKLIQDNYKR